VPVTRDFCLFNSAFHTQYGIFIEQLGPEQTFVLLRTEIFTISDAQPVPSAFGTADVLLR
jgi:hypothetical protein